jgi:hypothetical protein
MPSGLRLGLAGLLSVTTLARGDGSGPRSFDAAFTLTTINGAPRPVLAAATLNCDRSLNSAPLNLFEVGTFGLVAQITLDSTAAGGTVSPQHLTVTGTYTRGQLTFTV